MEIALTPTYQKLQAKKRGITDSVHLDWLSFKLNMRHLFHISSFPIRIPHLHLKS